VQVRLIEPRYGAPGGERALLYPKYLARVRLDFRRLLTKPRVFRAVVVVDACSGKVERADMFPATVEFESDAATMVPLTVGADEAGRILDAYARRRLGRRFLTYWPPVVAIEELVLAYKAFWVVAVVQGGTHLLDSVTGNRLKVRGAVPK